MRYFPMALARDGRRGGFGPVVWIVFAVLTLLLGALIYFGGIHGSVANNRAIVPTSARTDQRKTR